MGGAARLEIPDMPVFPRMSHAAVQTRQSVFGQAEASRGVKIRAAVHFSTFPMDTIRDLPFLCGDVLR